MISDALIIHKQPGSNNPNQQVDSSNPACTPGPLGPRPKPLSNIPLPLNPPPRPHGDDEAPPGQHQRVEAESGDADTSETSCQIAEPHVVEERLVLRNEAQNIGKSARVKTLRPHLLSDVLEHANQERVLQAMLVLGPERGTVVEPAARRGVTEANAVPGGVFGLNLRPVNAMDHLVTLVDLMLDIVIAVAIVRRKPPSRVMVKKSEMYTANVRRTRLTISSAMSCGWKPWPEKR